MVAADKHDWLDWGIRVHSREITHVRHISSEIINCIVAVASSTIDSVVWWLLFLLPKSHSRIDWIHKIHYITTTYSSLKNQQEVPPFLATTHAKSQVAAVKHTATFPKDHLVSSRAFFSLWNPSFGDKSDNQRIRGWKPLCKWPCPRNGNSHVHGNHVARWVFKRPLNLVRWVPC